MKFHEGNLLIRPRRGRLGPGFYIAGSNTPAYADLRARIAAGELDLAGERYLLEAGLIKYTTALSPQVATGRRRVAANPVIGMGPESFVRELESYNDWKLKWWREVVQNSVDAGATQIDMGAAQTDLGWSVWCVDNGGGMSESVLVGKFLYLGGTTKVSSPGVAGGFGVAKKLILLPWVRWEILTGDVHVVGVGVEYYRTDDPSPQAREFFARIGYDPGPVTKTLKGTMVRVLMPPDNYTYGAMATALLEKCYLPGIKFTVDGQRVKANLKARDLIDGVPGKAEVYYTKKKGHDSSHLLVRSNGLFMFDLWIDRVEGVLIAELTAPSIEILTSNRDGFRDAAVRRMISNLGTRIAKDTQSALKAKRGLARKKFKGTGMFQAEKKERMSLNEAEVLEAASSLVPDSNGKLGRDRLVRIAETLAISRQMAPGTSFEVIDMISPTVGKTLLESTSFMGVDHMENAIKQLVWEPDFYVINEIENWRVPRKFWPETMTPTVSRLARVWTELCRYVLIQLGCGLPFGVGWIFSLDAGAAYQPGSEDSYGFQREGEHWLVLNPFKDVYDRKTIWRPATARDLKWLYASAIHEATHMADGISYHDESFARALTHNMAKCADGFRHVKKIVSGIKLKGKTKADSPRGRT